MTDRADDVTAMVVRWSNGDEAALGRLVEFVYEDLRQIARRQLRSASTGETMHTTVLVHELYLKLAGVSEGTWGGRAQFFAFCAKAMRHILIDYARHHQAQKRGGGRVPVTLTDENVAMDQEVEEVLAVDEALRFLARRDARMADIVECRLFGGLSVTETAEALGTSSRTVERDWARARAYLAHLLDPDMAGGDGGDPRS